MESQGFVSFEHKQDMYYTQNSTLKDRKDDELKNLECFVIENNQESVPNIFVPTDVYLGSFKLEGNIENVIELINVDPNQTADILSANQEANNNQVEKDVKNPNRIVLNLNGSYQCCSNEPFLPYISTDDLSPNNFDICETQAKESEESQKAANFECEMESNDVKLEEKLENEKQEEESDEVVFVCEYKLENGSKKSQKGEAVKNCNDKKSCVEKRKNPVRKAHIDKVSQDLIEKLSYHPSVFNAKIRRKRTKPQPVVEQKNLRQSCRTTGAIYYPPLDLSEHDYKIWPETAHEIPLYNEKKQIIELVPQRVNNEGITPNIFKSKPNLNLSLKAKVLPKRNEIKTDNFESVMTKSLNNVLKFTKTYKQFKKLTTSDNLKKVAQLQPFDLELKGQEEFSLNDRKNVCQENLENAMFYDLIENTCILYSMATNQNNKQVAEVIKSYSTNKS